MIKNIAILFLLAACSVLGFLYWSSYTQVNRVKAELKQSIKPSECLNFMPNDIEPVIECPKGLTFHRNPESESGESLVREFCSVDGQDGTQKRIGPFVKRNMAGSIRCKGSYNQYGKTEGIITCYNNNGQKNNESQMLNGEMDGFSTYFRPDGSIDHKEIYKNGVQLSGIKNPVIQFTKKRFLECAKNTTCLEFSIVNKTEQRIEQWELTATIRNNKGEVIGTSSTAGARLEPEKSIDASFSFPNIKIDQVAYYSIVPSSIEIQLNGHSFSAQQEFTIKE